MWRPHYGPISNQTLPSTPHGDSEAAPDRPTGKNCSDPPCQTTLTGSWTVAGLRQRVITQPRPIAAIGRTSDYDLGRILSATTLTWINGSTMRYSEPVLARMAASD